MIKIELVKFEAQDVITASEQKPTSVPATTIQIECPFCQKFVDRGTECENKPFWLPDFKH